jgi:hypothetical protein
MTWQEQVLTDRETANREVDITTRSGLSMMGRVSRVDDGGVWITSGSETIVVDIKAIEDIRLVP